MFKYQFDIKLQSLSCRTGCNCCNFFAFKTKLLPIYTFEDQNYHFPFYFNSWHLIDMLKSLFLSVVDL